MALPANIRVNVNAPFPSLVTGSGPITIGKQNGIWTFGFTVAGLGIQNPPPVSHMPTDYVMVWDSTAKQFVQVPLSVIIGQAQNVLYLGPQYGVVGDNATDNSAAIARAISDAAAIGSNVTLVFPGGKILAPSLSATVTGTNIWFMGAGGPGSSVIVFSASLGLTWSTTYGGTLNMGFDYSGANGANVSILDHGSSVTAHINPYIGPGVGTFYKMDSFGLSGQVFINGAFGGGNNNASTPLFNIAQGAGFILRNSQLNQNGGTAASGRIILDAGSTGQFDTIILEDNTCQLYDGFINAVALNGNTNGNIFLEGNVIDNNHTSCATFTANSGGELINIYINDPWITALNGPAISFAGAGNFNNIQIKGRIVSSGTHGIISTCSGSFNNFKMDGVEASDLNVTAAGTAYGLSLAGGTGYKNISIVGCQVGILDLSSTNQPTTGCNFGAAIDHLTFVGNNFQGSSANYNGMLAGTSSTFAHTNSKQRSNIGLQDAPVLAINEGGTGTSVQVVPVGIEFSQSVNFNSANTDTPFTITLPTGTTRYIISFVRISGASGTLTTATAGLFTAASGGGTAIVTAASSITVSSGSDNTLNNTQAMTVNNQQTQSYNLTNESTLYFRVANPQGSAATANVTIAVVPLP